MTISSIFALTLNFPTNISMKSKTGTTPTEGASSSLNRDKDQPVLEDIIKHMTNTTVLQ